MLTSRVTGMNESDFNNIVVDIDYYNHRICTPSWEIVPRVTDFVDVTYVVSGEAEYTIDGVCHTVRAGDLICVQKGCRESAFVNPNNLMDCYCVNGKVFNISGKEIPLLFQMVTHIGIQEDIIALYQELNAAWLLRDPGYKAKARAIYMLILLRYYQLVWHRDYQCNCDKRIKKVLQHVIDHYDEPLSVEEMAKMTKLSPLYFGSFFKQETGQTFRQYLTSIRINQAENMLNSGMYNVSEVAAECGFSDVFYFSKVFKEHRGLAPSEILKSRKMDRSRVWTDRRAPLKDEQSSDL
jgi:AraC-like DNA-binding protein